MANKKKHQDANIAFLPVETESQKREHLTEKEALRRELDSRQVEARFMEAIANGSLDGDVKIYDENNEIIRTPKPRITIFDLQ